MLIGAAWLSIVALAARAEDWPGWRGPTYQGISTENDLPIRWSATENVAWKTPIAGQGWSSPIVFGDRVFVTATDPEGVKCRVICLDRVHGNILWDKEVFEQTPKNKAEQNSYATPTPCTDGQRVFAVFGDGSFVALGYDGEIVWLNREQKFYGQHGLGTSPILHGDLLLMARDGSSEGEDRKLGWQMPWDKGTLLALDKRSGKVRWKGPRGQSRIAHVVPNVFRDGDCVQIVSGAGDVVQGFDPATGRRLWSVVSRGEGVVPSIVIGSGLVFSASGFGDPAIRAIQPVTADNPIAKIVWESKKAVPMVPSFVYADGLLFAVNESGIAQCLDAPTGKLLWQQRIGGHHFASPICAGGRVYFLSESGDSTIIAAGRQFKLVAKNAIGEKCQASYAVSHGQIFIRTEGNLYCIGVDPKGK
jgi:outer membrane protein assembly factor BamB